MKSLNNKNILYIELILAILAFAAGVPLVRYSVAARNNSKALQRADMFPGEACAYMIKAARFNPNNPVAHLNLGLLYSSQTDGITLENFLNNKQIAIPDSTATEFEKAVALSVNEPIPLMNLAFVSVFIGDNSRALRLLEPLIGQEFCWSPVRILYGIILENQGVYDKALKTYADAVASAPIILESRFFSDLEKRDSLMAMAVIVNAKSAVLQEYSRNGNPLNTAVLGEIEYMDGDVDNAVKHLEEALEALPSMNRPWLFLGRIEETRGNNDAALECYEKAVRLDEHDALPVYFKARAEGKASVMAEQMMHLLSLEQRHDLRRRYGVISMTNPLMVKEFERYCTYDYVEEIERNRNETNISVMNDVMSCLEAETDKSVRNLTAVAAEKMLGIPYEAGMLDVYPESLRVYLGKTDNLHFVEACLAMALTADNVKLGNDEIIEQYDLLCDNIRMLRYRNGVISKFSDRIFYFTEWSGQAEFLGTIEELSEQYGHEYRQSFSYLSEHLMFFPQIGHEPKARDEVLEIEYSLSGENPLFAISPDEMTAEFYESLQDGDIVAFVSERKGEDVNKIGIVKRNGLSINLISASYDEKKVVSEDFMQLSQASKGVRLFRIII